MGDLFEDHSSEYDRWYEDNRCAYLSELEAVRRMLPRTGFGLEIGVGSGRFAAPLGIQVGVDPSPAMAKLAGGRGVDARLGRGERLEFPDRTFDYVAVIFTLCFVEDPPKVISEASRVMKSGGKIIIGIVDRESFLGRAYLEKESIFYGIARFFTVDEIVGMLEVSGFGDLSFCRTISVRPEKMRAVEPPGDIESEGAFVVIGGVAGVRADK